MHLDKWQGKLLFIVICKCCILHQPHNQQNYPWLDRPRCLIPVGVAASEARVIFMQLSGTGSAADAGCTANIRTAGSKGGYCGNGLGSLVNCRRLPSVARCLCCRSQACIFPCRGRAVGRSCRLIIRHIIIQHSVVRVAPSLLIYIFTLLIQCYNKGALSWSRASIKCRFT